MFFAGLLALGERLEAAGKVSEAGSVYGTLVDVGAKAPPYGSGNPPVANGFSPGGFSPDLLNPTVAKARQRLDALTGRGSTSLRAEVLIRDFTNAATDYRMIVPMMAGTMVGQLAGAGIMGRLANTTRASWLTRGMGARAAAKLGGFALEVPAFAGLSHWLSGGEGSFDQHLQSAGITLGAIKLAGWGTQSLARRAGVFSNRPWSAGLMQQTGMFGGLMAAHRLEVALGLRPGVDGATTVTDTLAAMVSLGVGGSLGNRMLGRPWLRLQQELRMRIEKGSETRPAFLNRLYEIVGPRPGLAMATLGRGNLPGLPVPGRSENLLIPRPLLMAAKGNGSTPNGDPTGLPLRMYSIPRGVEKGKRRFQPHLILPNLHEAIFEILVDADRNLEIPEKKNGQKEGGQLLDPTGKVLESFSVHKVENFKSRLELRFRDRSQNLVMEFTIEEPRAGDASGYRLALNPNRAISGPAQLKAGQAPKASTVRQKHFEFISDRGLKGNRGGIQKYHFWLTNGDRVELEVAADHKRAGYFKAQEAALNPFSDKTGEQWITLAVKGEGQGSGKILINGEGYEIELPIRPPSGSRGNLVDFSAGMDIKKAPSVASVSDPKSCVDAREGITLIPDAESVWHLNHPRWDESKVTLKFVGHVGGVEVDPRTPLAIDGVFKEGRFVPDLAPGEERKFVIHLSKDQKPVHATLKEIKGEYRLEIPMRGDHTVSLPLQIFGSLIGFGNDKPRTQTQLLELFQKSPAARQVDFLPDQWEPASPEVRRELTPFFHRHHIAGESAQSISQGVTAPHIIRVQLEGGPALYFLRKVIGELGTEFELIQDKANPEKIFALTLAREPHASLEGLTWISGDERRQLNLLRGYWKQDLRDPNRFFDSALPSNSILLDPKTGSLKLEFSLLAGEGAAAGLLETTLRNGKDELVFQLDNGHVLHLQLPKGLPFLDAILNLGIKPADWESSQFNSPMRFKAEERDVHDNKIAEGEVFPDRLEWILQMGDKRKAFHLNPFHAEETQISVRIQDPQPYFSEEALPTEVELEAPAPVVPTPPAEEKAPPFLETPVPGEELPAPKIPEVLPPATPSEGLEYFLWQGRSRIPRFEFRPSAPELKFPWDEGTFVSPAQGARELMRRALLEPGSVKEGEQAVFEFFGDPMSPDMQESRARVILDKMKRFGDDALYFYAWIVRLPMIFQSGEWIPDSSRKMQVERRIPRRGRGQRLVGNYRIPGFDGEFPVIFSTIGTSWGVQVGRDRFLRPYRVLLEKFGAKLLSPDFALSMGEPTPMAKQQLTNLETFTFLSKIHSGQLRALSGGGQPPIQVDADYGDGFRGRVTPDFGDPIYRSHFGFQGHEGIFEFAPGFSDRLPGSVFSIFKVYDGNGLNWRLAFQHWGDQFRVVGLDSNEKPLRIDQLDIDTSQPGTIVISGILPSKYRSLGVDGLKNLPFQVAWYREDNDWFLIHFDVGDERISPGELKFNPDHWKKEDIFQTREGKDLMVKVTRVEGRSNVPPGNPPLDPIKDKKTTLILPEDYPRLAQDRKRFSPDEKVRVVYYLEGEGDEKRTLVIPLKYNDRQRTYEPDANYGTVMVFLDGVAFPLGCLPTNTGRNWRLTFPKDRNPFLPSKTGGKGKKKSSPKEMEREQVFLGNFYVNESDNGGRPVPILWQSHDADPHRRVVNYILEKQGRAPGIVEVVSWKDDSPDAPQSVDLVGRGKRYRIPFHMIALPTGRYLSFPTGPAERRERDEWVPNVVNYFKALRGSPAVVEFDGVAYEMEVQDRKRYPELSLRRAHPGASGVYTDERSRASVMLQPHDKSAYLLIDLNPEDWLEEIRAVMGAKEIPQKRVKRALWDGISRETYEFVFDIARTLLGHNRLSLVGMARLTTGGPVVLSQEVLEEHGKIYIRTPEGHYISLSSFPNHALNVSSHGKVLDPGILKKTWTQLKAAPELFSQKPYSFDLPISRKLFFNKEENRSRVWKEIAENFGVEPDLLWDWNREFPSGTYIPREDFDPGHPDTVVYQRGALKVVIQKPQGILEVERADVTYHGEPIPSRIAEIEGRPFLLLGGPLSGVTLYWSFPKRGIYPLIEFTHPALREQLEKDEGHDPIRRGVFVKKDQEGNRFKYPKVEGELKEALDRQIALSRLWRLREKGVLPPEPEARLKIASLLIPDPENYSLRRRPALLKTLEQMAQEAPFRIDLTQVLWTMGHGKFDEAKFAELTEAWKHYRALPEEPGRTRAKAIEKLIGLLSELGRG